MRFDCTTTLIRGGGKESSFKQRSRMGQEQNAFYDPYMASFAIGEDLLHKGRNQEMEPRSVGEDLCSELKNGL